MVKYKAHRPGPITTSVSGKGVRERNSSFSPTKVEPFGLEVDGVDRAEGPVEQEEGLLILGWELRAVAEGDADGRAGADLDVTGGRLST